MAGANSYLACVAAVLVASCASPRSPREEFLSSVDSERGNYVKLYEVSLESLRDREDETFRATRIAVYGAREASLECTNNCAPLQARLDRIQLIGERLRDHRLKIYDQLRDGYDSKTDSILYYYYRSSRREGEGFMVTRGARVKKKISFEADLESE
jgi:hypothetical protein